MAARIHAPEFPPDLEWVGSPRPLTLAELRGQVVVLDFWTYCCINCMHVHPVLRELEERRRDDPVVVIGVHSAKFDAEDEPARIRSAMARYGIRHPVVVDSGLQVWQRFAIRSWPTLVIVRPDGTLAAVAPGEVALEPLDELVGNVLSEARADSSLASTPFRLEAVAEEAPALLSFPGKVVARRGGRLAVSDSGHHRVLLVGAGGGIEGVIGSGRPGLRDGALTEARFNGPQGLGFDGDVLFVADTGNHAVREVDLVKLTVRTVAGTGSLGRAGPRSTAAGKRVELRSPWDLVVAGDYVLVAMAGSHQIWVYDRRDGTIGVLAGSGRESIQDGPFPQATFAQPSGLALAGSRLYVADSETSSVRYLDLEIGEVHTLVGTDLFDFGDRDGSAERALLQHPVGVSWGPLGLLVADTYNDKIKVVDPESGGVRTWFAGAGGISLREPTGLCQLEDGTAVVADTNHHRLVLVSSDGTQAEVLELHGVPAAADAGGEAAPEIQVQVLEAARAGPGPITLRVHLRAAEGFDLAVGSRASMDVEPESLIAVEQERARVVGGEDPAFEVRLGAPAESIGEPAVHLKVDAVVCGHGDRAACWPVSARYRLPLRVEAGAAKTLDVNLDLPVPQR